MDVSGRLTPGFIVENQRVMVKLTHVSPPPEGADGPELWIAATDVTSPRRLPLRSHLWELPAGQEREFVLRKLSIAVADCVAAGGRQVQLAREIPGTTALLFDVDVPLHDATSYLWNFAAAAGYCRGRSVPWQPAGPVTARAELDDAARANAVHYASQLPLWLTSRQFWSVFQWENDRLVHIIQFSLPDKLHRALQRRFRLNDA